MFKAGDVIGVSGKDHISDAINICSLGIPRIGVHHLAVVSELHGRPILYESKGMGEMPCDRSGRLVNGVQAHYLDDWLDNIKRSNVWHYSLRCELYEDEKERLLYFLDSIVGAPYDKTGAIKSGGILVRAITRRFCPENTQALFCSEMVADALLHIGRFYTDDVSAWSPNRLSRTLVNTGICNRAKLIRKIK
jgi:hypothetical protein